MWHEIKCIIRGFPVLLPPLSFSLAVVGKAPLVSQALSSETGQHKSGVIYLCKYKPEELKKRKNNVERSPATAFAAILL